LDRESLDYIGTTPAKKESWTMGILLVEAITFSQMVVNKCQESIGEKELRSSSHLSGTCANRIG